MEAVRQLVYCILPVPYVPQILGQEQRKKENRIVYNQWFVNHTIVLQYSSLPVLLTHPQFPTEAIHFQQLPGSSRAVVATQRGALSLITIPPMGTRKPASVISTWLDITARVYTGAVEQGFLGFAFHPDFIHNGRFFVSYICNADRTPDCKVRLASALRMCIRGFLRIAVHPDLIRNDGFVVSCLALLRCLHA